MDVVRLNKNDQILHIYRVGPVLRRSCQDNGNFQNKGCPVNGSCEMAQPQCCHRAQPWAGNSWGDV